MTGYSSGQIIDYNFGQVSPAWLYGAFKDIFKPEIKWLILRMIKDERVLGTACNRTTAFVEAFSGAICPRPSLQLPLGKALRRGFSAGLLRFWDTLSWSWPWSLPLLAAYPII